MVRSFKLNLPSIVSLFFLKKEIFLNKFQVDNYIHNDSDKSNNSNQSNISNKGSITKQDEDFFAHYLRE